MVYRISGTATAETTVVSLSRKTKLANSAGRLRMPACGRMTCRSSCQRDNPMDRPDSICALGTASIPARRISVR
ncbi:Putative N-acetylmannosamine-6-phosphate epimerase [Pseudomonas syringae pv. actinidiae]|uniref:N-acetylmannosamine-6-phosphate epimerase n=1 Tax=Pseudomonas syringae pv. actinidiae TaxID=103796 RepID=A0A2V0QJL2_PSESF|nr:Putative N-acetylmannosamine-6-phosphate epimerase [Pseudomonas syringae pv. actinidiae]